MSADFIARLVGMVVFAGLGIYWGIYVGNLGGDNQALYAVIFALVGALVGLIITPYISTRPVRALRGILSRVSSQTLVSGFIGLLAGLIVAALLALPLSALPSPFGEVLPFVGVILFAYLGIAVFVMRQDDIFSVFRMNRPGSSDASAVEDPEDVHTILLDTRVIIDGRIADISKTGFMFGTFLIPRFVLNELQYIADSADSMRRQRGRRGMEVLSQLQKDATVPVRISDIDVEGVREVDDKLVVLARQMKAPIMTNDYNLNRVAELQGVTVLNVNELANAVKSVLLPGEQLLVKIIQEGKESGQGVGYLDDGTMVVVEDGRGRINQEVDVNVTKVLQTAAGRMIFAQVIE